MVVRKLTANPPTERDQYTELALRLEGARRCLREAQVPGPREVRRRRPQRRAGTGADPERSGRGGPRKDADPRCPMVSATTRSPRSSTSGGSPLARVGGEVRRHRSSPGTTQRSESVHSRFVGGRRMPAQRVGSAPIAIRQFEVVGQDASVSPVSWGMSPLRPRNARAMQRPPSSPSCICVPRWNGRASATLIVSAPPI